MTLRSLALTVVALAACSSRGSLSDAEAAALVRDYNEKKIEAFRTGDPRLVDPVTSAAEGRKILGLIGVKLDAGITLHARILSLEVLEVRRPGEVVEVHTTERWQYADRAMGSGAQVGEASTDSYRMRYLLRRIEGAWVVDAIGFVAPPVIGRRAGPVQEVPAELHGSSGARDADRRQVGGPP